METIGTVTSLTTIPRSVIAALLVTLILTFVAKPIARWARRRLLRWLAYKERRWSRRRLRAVRRAHAGYRSARLRRPPDYLASFSVRVAGGEPVPGVGLLEDISGPRVDAFLLNAKSGEGKTTLALALASQRPSRAATAWVPFYFDAADRDFDARLAKWSSRVMRATSVGETLRDRPLILLDGVNERLTPEHFASLLGSHVEQLRDVRARVVILYAFRSRGYTGRLSKALSGIGLENLSSIDLLPLHKDLESDHWAGRLRLAALRPFSVRGIRNPTALRGLVDGYAQAQFGWPLTRADFALAVQWAARQKRAHPVTHELVASIPSPAELVGKRYLSGAVSRESQQAILWLGRVAFELLHREAGTLSLRDLPGTQSADESAQASIRSGLLTPRLAEAVTLRGAEIVIHDEQAIRLLAAIRIADAFQAGADDKVLRPIRGRVAFDAAVPYLAVAAAWHPAGLETRVIVDRIRDHLIRAGDPTQRSSMGFVPYSFFGRILRETSYRGSSADEGLAQHRAETEERLFDSIVREIDSDRQLTCRDSIVAARRSDQLPYPNPVLDQLFQLVDDPTGSLVRPLCRIMAPRAGRDPHPTRALVKSQSAYLLLEWIRRTSSGPPHRYRDAMLARVRESIDGSDGNLHLRFHQSQLLDALQDHASGTSIATIGSAVWSARAVAKWRPADYSRIAACVSLHLAYTVRGVAVRPTRAQLVEETAALWQLEVFAVRCPATAIEESLECWEVALGLSAQAFRLSRAAPQDLSQPIISALTHELWIVRWWAFANLVDIYRYVVDRGRLDSTASHLAELIVQRLFATDEPIGLKQQQCDLVEATLRRGPRSVAKAELGARVREAFQIHVGADQGRAFTLAYAELLRQPADRYVQDYLRRLDQLLVVAL